MSGVVITGLAPEVSRLVIFVARFYGRRRQFREKIDRTSLTNAIVKAIFCAEPDNKKNTVRDREVVLRYFGFYVDRIPRNATVLASFMGIDAKTINVIVGAFLKKLRESQGFRDFLEKFLVEDDGVSR